VSSAERLWGPGFDPDRVDAGIATLVKRGHARVDPHNAQRFAFALETEAAFEVLRAVHAQGRLERAVTVAKASAKGRDPWERPGRALGLSRALLVLGQPEVALADIERFADRLRPSKWDPYAPPFELRLFGLDPELAWLEQASDNLVLGYTKALGTTCTEALVPLEPTTFDRLLSVLEDRGYPPAKRYPSALLQAAMLWLPADRTTFLPSRRGKAVGRKLELMGAFAAGDFATAYARGVQCIEARAPARGALDGFDALAFLFAALDAARRNEPGAWLHIEAVLSDVRDDAGVLHHPFDLLSELYLFETRQARPKDVMAAMGEAFERLDAARSWPTFLVAGLVSRWLDVPLPADAPPISASVLARVERIGTPVLPATFAALADPRADIRGTLLELYATRAPWEHVVEQLEAFADQVAPPLVETTEDDAFKPSIVWQVEDDAEGDLMVSPRLIASPRSHGGRAIRIEDVEATFEHIADAHDRRAAAAYREVDDALSTAWTKVSVRETAAQQTFALAFALVGHPRVRDPSGAPVSVVRASPRLVVDGDDQGARLSIEPSALVHVKSVAHEWDGPHRLQLYACDERIATVFGALDTLRGGRMPHEAVSRLRPTLARLTEVLTLQGRGTVDLDAHELPAHAGIDVDLEWRDPTLRIEIGVRPLGPHGPRCQPGQGQPDLVADTGEGLRTTLRDLDAEAEALRRVLQACPLLAELEVDDSGGRFVVGLQRACALLEEITQAAASNHLTIGWPRGKALRLSREYDRGDLDITIRKGQTQWLAVEAGLQIDAGQVVAWKLLAQGRAGANRFVQLDTGEVVRLSAALRRTLDALARLDRGGGEANVAEVPDLVLAAADELLGDTLQLADDVAQRKRAITAAFGAEFPVPDGLRAELRDYQQHGFTWMMRLASAGLGGVLADDMGLGKTVQSLAVLLARAARGPALVVCPTSVLINWRNEAARFTPDLRVHDVGALPTAERLATLEAIEPGEVALMSYGVLQRLGDDAEGLRFATVVFDEVHALKNATTARARVAAQIRADVRLGLTGTPLENNIGELWAVMNACVPGLLGDRVLFTESLGKAASEGVKWAQRHLRALLDPFILRRTKDAVLTELPPRTEAVVMVQPSEAERAWYEAQRQAAEARIRDALEEKRIKPGQASVRLLAEIGRLRQAAIEPRLVEEDAPRGAKLDQVVERCQQLVSAGHQVLVFTQFLGVIAMLDERLRKRGIETLDLQGNTPAAERARRIDAFQAGEADVFLMSLRAGGVGVNLTAADYVLHVDPWWNPAVEAQATGRAHRMGQTRPVTVYRYCTEGSIERKILALHETKRELAEGVLEGMGGRKSLDVEALHALLARW